MDIDRRRLLKTLALTGLASPVWTGWSTDSGTSPVLSDFHPLTRLLLQRAQLASNHTGPVRVSITESSLSLDGTAMPALPLSLSETQSG